MMNILFHLLLLVAFTKLSYGYHKLNHPIVRQKDISVLGKDMKSTRLKCHTIESIVSLTCLSDSFPLAIDLPEINLVDETSALSPLGNDLLVFLFATIGIVPLFKWLNASPVIGFLVAGLLMGPAGLHLFSDLNDMESIADFGVLFLLFEQGLELTVERLQGLSKFAFGMGTLQVLLCSAAFFVFPFIGGVQFLEFFVGAQPNLVDITRIDEALVIGVALSLSSSAFCLKILQEKKQLSTTHGAAALGILLLQDIAVVPLLVLLPIIESSVGPMTISDQVAVLGATFAKALFGLGGILLFGGRIVRFLFSLVAQTRSSETFVALCLVVALGTGALTDWLGLSSTLGAFTAGTLLAESNYRTQIESDIKPFRGLLLGLFFITTGASVQPSIITDELPTVLALLAGLITFKAVIITSIGPLFQLSKTESIKTGMLLSGGGEFAFVVLTLADKLHVLPDKLAKILVGVVVISMALTPYLSNLGDEITKWIEEKEEKLNVQEATKLFESTSSYTSSLNNDHSENKNNAVVSHDSTLEEAVVICGFNQIGRTVATFISDPIFQNSLKSPSQTQNYVNQTQIIDYVAFDLDPNVVIKGYRDGLRVLYGDGCQPLVLLTAGIQSPKAFIITYPEQETRIKAVEKLRQAFPDTPIISRVSGVDQYYELIQSGANNVYIQEREASYSMFTALLSALNVNFEGVQQVDKTISTQSNLAITNENLPIFAIDQLIRRLREQNDKLDRETLKKRKSEKTGWSRDVLTNRINVPDTAYFESFRRSFAASFSGESLSVSNVLDQVSSKFKGVLGSVKIGSDGYSETDLVDYLWLDQGESVNSKPAPISDSPSVNEEFSDQMSIQFVTKKEGMSTTMSEQESMLKILSEASDENKMGVTMCPLPPREENRS